MIGLTVWRRTDNKTRLTTSTTIVLETIVFPSLVLVCPRFSRVGIITAIEEDIKMIPINKDEMSEKSSK